MTTEMTENELRDRHNALQSAQSMNYAAQSLILGSRWAREDRPRYVDFGLVWAGGDLRPGQRRMQVVLAELHRDVTAALDRAREAMEAIALEPWE